MIDNLEFANQANSEKYTGVPYSKLDCQAFVEKVLSDCGVKKSDGTPYNWKGSNSMWRSALSWKGTVAECIKRFGCIPLGAWVFIVRQDGGEKERGYNDAEGNAKHVGIYCSTGPEPVRDSTTNNRDRSGVGYRSIKDFTHVGLPYMIDFNNIIIPEPIPENNDRQKALEALETIRQYIMKGE